MTTTTRRLAPALALLCLLAHPAFGEGEVEVRRNLVVKAVEKARPGTVSIQTTQLVRQRYYDADFILREDEFEREGSLGSGVIFHPGGYVITNAHVIARASDLYVHVAQKDGSATKRRAAAFAVDVANDLAILRILPEESAGGAETFGYLALGRSNDLMMGETVIAVGNAFTLGLSVSTGVVSALNRKVPIGNRQFDDFIQIDAAINPGNSGGPLFDVTGRWIGVNTAIYNRRTGAEGIGFAIPADRVRRLIGGALKRRLVTGEWMGIEETEGLLGAVVVDKVFPKGPAVRSGLQEKDVLTSVNGKPTPTLYDYRMEVLALPKGATVRLGVVRNGVATEGVTLPLVPVPTDDLSLKHLGLAVAEDADTETGVAVRAVTPDGPAAGVGIRPGDVIVGLGAQKLWKIRNADELLLFLQWVQPGDLVDVQILRPVSTGGQGSPRPLSGTLKAR